MRSLIILLISLLLLSNVASAAMLCCLSDDEPHLIESAVDMPCHGMEATGDYENTQSQSECECPGCSQISSIPSHYIASPIVIDNPQPSEPLQAFSPDPEIIYHPPK